jgi:hypothetical protein
MMNRSIDGSLSFDEMTKIRVSARLVYERRPFFVILPSSSASVCNVASSIHYERTPMSCSSNYRIVWPYSQTILNRTLVHDLVEFLTAEIRLVGDAIPVGCICSARLQFLRSIILLLLEKIQIKMDTKQISISMAIVEKYEQCLIEFAEIGRYSSSYFPEGW